MCLTMYLFKRKFIFFIFESFPSPKYLKLRNGNNIFTKNLKPIFISHLFNMVICEEVFLETLIDKIKGINYES